MMHTINTPKTKKVMLALIIPTLMAHLAHADESVPEVTLEAIDINIDRRPKEKVGEEITTRRELDEQNIQNAHDLVRYNTEVDVAEVGRYGNKGFAIRGVDGNRVAMNIDGVALPEVEVNEIFSPYGYMYEGRFNPDVEMMGSVSITAGADSLVSGSGAVGGAVSYKTKEPQDLIRANNKLGGYLKTGYATKNDEWVNAVGLAGQMDKWEFLVNYAHRDGKETKNHDMRKSDKARLDPLYLFPASDMPYNSTSPRYDGSTSSLIYPDPLHFKRDSVIGKLYYNFNDSHRVGFHTMYQKQKNHMNTDSKNVISGSRLATGSGGRRSHDIEELESYGINYRFMPASSAWLDTLEADYTHNKTLGLADTWIYDRTLNSDETAVASSVGSSREYRPTETTIDQVSLKLKAMPLNLGKFGEHGLTLHTNYAKQDYTSTSLYKYFDGKPDAFNVAFADAKKNIYSIGLTDNIYFSDRLKAMVGVRYDNYKYNPYFQNFNEHRYITNTCTTPQRYNTSGWNSEGLFCQAYREEAGLTKAHADAWEADRVALQPWRDENYGKYTGLKKTKFNHITWGAGIDYELIPNKLTTRYKIGTGFLAPTVTHIYSNFTFNGNTQIPSYDLKPETSLNQEIEFDWKATDNINLTIGGYLSKYDDFIHTKYWRGNNRNPNNKNCPNGYLCLQSTNLDKTQVHGIKLGVNADLSEYLNSQGKFNVFANFHTAKDSATIETDKDGTFKVNTLAAVPTSLLLGGTYTSADERWQLNGRINYVQRKKPKDVKNIEVGTQVVEGARTPVSWATDRATCVVYANGTWVDNQCYRVQRTTNYYEYASSYDQVHRSKSVMIYDLYGTAKFGKNKNWIVNAGIYNLTDVKYIPWETLRQFASTSVNNMVDAGGHGFNRYTAPGRNYALSLTYEF